MISPLTNTSLDLFPYLSPSQRSYPSCILHVHFLERLFIKRRTLICGSGGRDSTGSKNEGFVFVPRKGINSPNPPSLLPNFNFLPIYIPLPVSLVPFPLPLRTLSVPKQCHCDGGGGCGFGSGVVTKKWNLTIDVHKWQP